MKPVNALFAAVMMTCMAAPLAAQTAPAGGGAAVAPPAAGRARTSPHETINATVDAGKRVVIVYGRPNASLRGGAPRKIWGTLVPWGQVWRLGSDEATLLVTEVPLVFGTVNVPAGTYSLYMMPMENEPSKLIINKLVGQWGIPYTPEQKAAELGQVDLKKDPVSSNVEQFTIAVTPKQGGGGGTLKLVWETTQYSVDFTVKK